MKKKYSKKISKNRNKRRYSKRRYSKRRYSKRRKSSRKQKGGSGFGTPSQLHGQKTMTRDDWNKGERQRKKKKMDTLFNSKKKEAETEELRGNLRSALTKYREAKKILTDGGISEDKQTKINSDIRRIEEGIQMAAVVEEAKAKAKAAHEKRMRTEGAFGMKGSALTNPKSTENTSKFQSSLTHKLHSGSSSAPRGSASVSSSPGGGGAARGPADLIGNTTADRTRGGQSVTSSRSGGRVDFSYDRM